MIEERKCKGPCDQWKPLSEYGKDPTMRDGLRSKCRVCINEHNREYKRGCRKGRPKSPSRTTLDFRDRLARSLHAEMQTYWHVAETNPRFGVAMIGGGYV